ncbi:hypothetical protein [Endozoicomonas sp. GU-1]|nr:hypothetical protein [Endozoicomonas sp. GU-1]WBA80274.1 hypothetical protein O2T12_18305 [Endozoicomonas sp. GU-1]WBA87844.1 hypothetical protein O3276_07515 [Endozoicomonas sp. GU-1]
MLPVVGREKTLPVGGYVPLRPVDWFEQGYLANALADTADNVKKDVSDS